MKIYLIQYQDDKDKYDAGQVWCGTYAAAAKEARKRAKRASVVVSVCEVPTRKYQVVAYLNGIGSAGSGHPLHPPPCVKECGVVRKPLLWNEDGESSKLTPYGTERTLETPEGGE